ncbi:glutathione S-transferase family protein [Pandoraea anhela]|uniref:Glutathione S-transferase n=1 Tax=Pandoraea anhela TaxID=2508295 RepID=A0A5E4W712_9BURK|nr:glutathione S-transferase N-terminal domain-containing protein [Pandoraea anhela]VVE20492.1 glutathione S-transferase [Pandoraea anhela]
MNFTRTRLMQDAFRSHSTREAVTVWGRLNSLNVQRVLFSAADLALPVDHIPAGGQGGSLSTPEFLALNPNALVPVLKDGPFVLWESNTIVRYLCRAYGHGAEDARDVALQERWMDWYGTEIGSHMTALWGHTKRGKPLPPASAEHHWRRATALWKLLAEPLEAARFLGGRDPGVADYAVGPAVHRWHAMAPHDDIPRSLTRWYEALSMRPAYQTYVLNAPL